MRRAFLVAAITASLAACGPPTVEEFIEDPEMLAEVMEECQLEVAQGKPKSEECRNAQEAAETMAANLMKETMGQIGGALKGLFE
ncbi:MAG: EexN family lipoprotein [Gammaproteobacteria bacterium]|nr:EexN family lipoprotein [Gammaproteobacteria bacterium]MDE0272895.1 EexN family lipoprotein [Gammaproteobacteria bacterium]